MSLVVLFSGYILAAILGRVLRKPAFPVFMVIFIITLLQVAIVLVRMFTMSPPEIPDRF